MSKTDEVREFHSELELFLYLYDKLEKKHEKAEAKIAELEKKNNICKTCGFSKDLQREPIILRNDIISLIECRAGRCEECGSQSEGWTIIGDNQYAKINKHWKRIISYIHKTWEEKTKKLEAENKELKEKEKKYLCALKLKGYRKDKEIKELKKRLGK